MHWTVFATVVTLIVSSVIFVLTGHNDAAVGSMICAAVAFVIGVVVQDTNKKPTE